MPFTTPKKTRAVGGSGAPASPSSASAGAPSQATPGYVNFSRILSANQPGAQAMASSLTGKVEQQGQQVASAIDNASSDFKGKVNAGRVQYQQQAVTGGHQGTAPTSADIYRAAGAASVAAQRGYSGPKDWKGAGIDTVALSGQAAEAQQAAQNLTTAGGRAAMLREGAGGGYSAGMSALDSALAGAAMGSRGTDLASLYGGLSQRLIDAQAAGGGLVTQATTDSAEAAKKSEEEAAALQTLADNQKKSEEDAAAYQAEMRRRYPRGAPQDPRLAPLLPGLYG